MKNENLKQYLMAQGAEYLANKIIAISEYDELLAKELDFLILKAEPKKLAKKINQIINGIIKNKNFVPWHKEYEFMRQLNQVLEVIENDLMPNDYSLAVDVIEKLFAVDEQIIEKVDGSNGCVGGFYHNLSELWGKVWLLADSSGLDILPKKIYDLLKDNSYGTRDDIIQYSAKALGKNGLDILEKLIKDHENDFKSYSLASMYQDIADGLGDVDKYVAAIENYSSINEDTVCDIAKRLIAKWRSKEAIDWLLHKPENIELNLSSPKIAYSPGLKRYNLLLEAWGLENMLEEAEKLRWALFEKTLSKAYYDDLLKYKSADASEEVKARAFSFATESYKDDITTVLIFLNEIQEFAEIAKIINKNYKELNGENYHFYRPLSKTLASAGYPLAACLLRRKLIDSILERATSKYYKYAISDLKIAGDYSANINDWLTYPTHTQYLENLKKDHGRKQSFWSNLEQNN